MDEGARDLHPRPQLSRAGWIDLCGVWQFAFDDGDRGLDERWQDQEDPFSRKIVVPFPPESPASGVADADMHPIVWYRRTFEAPPGAGAERLILHCGAVDYRADVWVNGRHVASHEGGHTPFSADVTTALQPGQEQVLVVRAEDCPGDLGQPRGKQDWRRQPHDIWYQRTTGIWQPVWMELVQPIHVTRLRWTTHADRASLGLDVSFSRASDRATELRVQLSYRGKTLVDDTYRTPSDRLQRTIRLDPDAHSVDPDDLLWSPDHPNLLDATLTLTAGGEVVDEVTSYVGLRTVGVGRGRFLLNGRPCFLRLVLEQGYWPESHLAAPSGDTLRREVELVKELGFNGIRIHQKVEDPRFLHWCDRLGLMVWGEMANAYEFSQNSTRRLGREWEEVLERDASHPCIVAWVPFNESWGVPDLVNDSAQRHFVRALYHFTKSRDPTRPVVANDGWEHLCGDIIGIHDYGSSADVIRRRYGSVDVIQSTLRDVQPGGRPLLLSGTWSVEQPIVLSEFGGIRLPSHGVAGSQGSGGSQDPSPSRVSTPEELLSLYRDLVEAVLDCQNLSGFCYTQLADTAQEQNGLLTESRTPKLAPERIRAVTARPSAALSADALEHLRRFENARPEPEPREDAP